MKSQHPVAEDAHTASSLALTSTPTPADASSTLDSVPPTCDLFCTVVDNYGDIGVCWRLARQLVAEHGWAVRLWVDDLKSFGRICPELGPAKPEQTVVGVTIRHWSPDFPKVEAADVVIEAFACNPPELYVDAMARRSKAPVWINLEYLSAEDWVLGCHGLPSPRAGTTLLKYFFFPGFSTGTGGLLCEVGLIAQRRAFQADLAAQNEFWRGLGLPLRQADECRVALFSYDNPALPALFRAWTQAKQAVTCIVPEATAAARWLADHYGRPAVAGEVFQDGALTVGVHAFVDQADYDRLLWGCDVLFVRGEDSFVRAQWVARPLIWHIYPQEEATHLIKLDAFLTRYQEDLPPEAAAALARLWQLWNLEHGGQTPGEADMAAAWADFQAARLSLTEQAERWVDKLANIGDLARNLVNFCEARL